MTKKKKKYFCKETNKPIIDFQYLAQLVEIHTVTDSESGSATTQQQSQQQQQQMQLQHLQQYQLVQQQSQQLLQHLGGVGTLLNRHRPNVISTNNFDDLTCRYDNGTKEFKAKLKP